MALDACLKAMDENEKLIALCWKLKTAPITLACAYVNRFVLRAAYFEFDVFESTLIVKHFTLNPKEIPFP
jgi:hypothetical protein